VLDVEVNKVENLLVKFDSYIKYDEYAHISMSLLLIPVMSALLYELLYDEEE
jgi:hypothetical protein